MLSPRPDLVNTKAFLVKQRLKNVPVGGSIRCTGFDDELCLNPNVRDEFGCRGCKAINILKRTIPVSVKNGIITRKGPDIVRDRSL